jgi:hypothetical protein
MGKCCFAYLLSAVILWYLSNALLPLYQEQEFFGFSRKSGSLQRNPSISSIARLKNMSYPHRENRLGRLMPQCLGISLSWNMLSVGSQSTWHVYHLSNDHFLEFSTTALVFQVVINLSFLSQLIIDPRQVQSSLHPIPVVLQTRRRRWIPMLLQVESSYYDLLCSRRPTV